MRVDQIQRAQHLKVMFFGMIIVTLVIATVVVAEMTQYTIAQKAGQGYGEGYTDGVNAAGQTYMAGKNYNPTCSFNHLDSYCLGYKAGYLLEWGKMIILH